MQTAEPRRQRRFTSRGRWVVASLVVGVVVGLSACTGPGKGSASAAADHPCTVGAAFDPPAYFDLACTVPLSEDEALYGKLYGTTLYSVVDSTLRATDLVDPQRSWSVSLPGGSQDSLVRPFLLAGTAVVMTGEKYEGDDQSINYTVNITGISTRTRDVSWERSVPVYSTALEMAKIGYSRASDGPETWVFPDAAEYDGGLLITLGPPVDTATMLLDPGTGEVRWTSDAEVVATAAGQYSVARIDCPSARIVPSWAIVDLQTGQVVAPIDVSSFGNYKAIDPYQYVATPDGDESDIGVLVRGSYVSGSDSSSDGYLEGYLLVSSVDASIRPFAPADDDVRYGPDVDCWNDAGQPVLLCLNNSRQGHSYGVDRASGQVLWTSSTKWTDVTVFHGRAYVRLGGEGGYTVVDVSTDEVKGNVNVYPIGYTIGDGYDRSRPIQVNEFGMVGMMCGSSGACTADDYVWAPASG